MKYIIILFFISLKAFSHDSISVNNKNIKDTLKFKSQIYISGYWNKTNTSNTSLYTFKTYNTLSSKKHIIFLETGYVYGIQMKSQLTNNDYNIIANFNFRRDKKIYYWFSTQYDKSYSLDINFRIQNGGGLGLYLFKSEKFYINISDGLIYEYSTYNNYRNSARLKIFLKSNNINLESSTYYQPSLINNTDFIIKSSNTLSISLKKWLGIQCNYTNNIVSLSEKRNELYTVGINFKF